MRALIQRVTSSKIIINSEAICESATPGILALVGFGQIDLGWTSVDKKLNEVIDKICNLRIFTNEKGRFDLSLLEIGGDFTLVPQFTLYADTSKGRRPEFFNSMQPQEATKYFDKLVALSIQKIGVDRVKTGKFGADMKVHLCNDGPVTIMLEF